LLPYTEYTVGTETPASRATSRTVDAPQPRATKRRRAARAISARVSIACAVRRSES
jgi:hypothetical protein